MALLLGAIAKTTPSVPPVFRHCSRFNGAPIAADCGEGANMRRIVFASDFSKASRKAFAAAVKAAKSARATLSIVHVLAPFLPVGPDQYVGPDTWEEIDGQARKWATRHLDDLTARARSPGVRATALLVEGTPAREITRFAKKNHADLLVIGTHGRTGLAKLFLGSVANHVIATAPCPVMTVRG
jgi:nucleotide-binding universal stress UspA family protein